MLIVVQTGDDWDELERKAAKCLHLPYFWNVEY